MRISDGVQTCALPICGVSLISPDRARMLLISWGENRARLSMLSSIVRIAVLPVAALRAAPSLRSGWSARSARLWVAAGLNPGTREASGAVGGEPLAPSITLPDRKRVA